MTDVWHKLIRWADRDRGKMIGVVLASMVVTGILGCRPMTGSILTPGEEVTSAQLASEAAVLNGGFANRAAKLQMMADELEADRNTVQQRLTAAQDDIDHQYALRAQIVNAAGGLAVGIAEGGFSAATGTTAAVTIMTTLLAAGGWVDGRRKDRVIAELKSKASEGPENRPAA